MKEQNLPEQQKFRLNNEKTEDLKVWKILIKQAHDGILLNGLTFQNPIWLYGLGGYTPNGLAWRLAINPNSSIYNNDSTNGVHKFLGLAITMCLSLEECSKLGLLILILSNKNSVITRIFTPFY